MPKTRRRLLPHQSDSTYRDSPPLSFGGSSPSELLRFAIAFDENRRRMPFRRVRLASIDDGPNVTGLLLEIA